MTEFSNPTRAQRWLHRFAVLAACATFPLVFVGGLVTSYDAGMTVPDWPTTLGQNMFTYPWLEDFHENWGRFVEHGHRLLGALVGMLTIVLAVWLWFAEPRRWMRWLGAVALAAVILQGVLGGLRVERIDVRLAVVHGCFAQVFFALMVAIAVFTSRSWLAGERGGEAADAGRLQRLGITTACFVLLQLVSGAVLRHLGATWALVVHLAVAFIIVVHVGLIAKRVFAGHAHRARLVRLTGVLSVLVVFQLMLGTGAWATNAGGEPYGMATVTRTQVILSTAHVAVGALVLSTCVVLTLFAYRDLIAVGADEPHGRNRPDAETRRRESNRAKLSISPLESRELWMAEGTA